MFLHKIHKIKIIAAIAVAVGGFTSCDEFLTENAESEISPASFYKDNAQLTSGLVAAYSQMSVAYSENHITWGEFRSDNLAPFGNNVSRNALHNSQLDPGEGVLRWREIYRAIDFINRVINEGQNIEGFDRNVIGQAYAMRAKAYFDLARVWGNIPVFTQSATGVGDVFKNQTSASDVISNVVIPDMIQAENLITVDASEFVFTRSSVYALQGEVYLWQNENQLAKVALENLIAIGKHSLVTSPDAWQDLFLNHSSVRGQEVTEKRQIGPELIFSFNYTLGRETPSSGLTRSYTLGAKITTITEQAEESWKSRFPIIDTLWNNKYPNTLPVFSRTIKTADGLRDSIVPIYGDWRLFATREGGDFEEGLGSVNPGDAKVHKWQKSRTGLRAGDDDTNVVVYRYADVILMLAEAELKLGNAPRSLELINQIRTARQLPLATSEQFSTDAGTPLDFLLDERRYELFGEGKRWWDLLRNNKALETLNPILSRREGNLAELTEDRLLWPISDIHLTENPNLVQNRGW